MIRLFNIVVIALTIQAKWSRALLPSHALRPAPHSSAILPKKAFPTLEMSSNGSGIIAGTVETIRAFSKSSLSSGSAASILQSITERALTTPPIAYFFALMAAGCGIPVSEDALCIFAGAVWPTLPHERQVRMYTALYLGVVVSDFITFWIGRTLRMGIFQPLAQKLKLEGTKKEESTSISSSDDKDASKREKIQRILQNSGDWIGFVIRFCVGTRGPLMLLAGFTNQVPFYKFALGASLGGLLTLPLQLYAGYTLGGRNPAAVVALVAGISSFVIAAAIAVAVASWGTLLVTQLRKLWTARATG